MVLRQTSSRRGRAAGIVAAVLVVCVAGGLAAPVAGAQVAGRVRLERRALVDDNGPRPALGASFFWLAWGYRHDRDRADANLRWLAARGVGFVRAFAEVGGGAWHDRTVDPRWPDYEDVIRGATRMANAHGLRVEWTVFAGGVLQTEEEFRVAVRRVVEALRPVAAGVMFVEIQNEEHGPSPALVRELAAYVRAELGVEVALTGTPDRELPAMYRGSAATIATPHFDRTDGADGWRFAWQAWQYWDLDHMPAAFVNNEPAGINASVRPENDPVKLAADALVTWIAGGAAYVLHHGAGIFGKAIDHPVGGRRAANAWEQPTLGPALMMIDHVRSRLPADVANWTRANNHWKPPLPTPPFRGDRVGDEPVAAGNGALRILTARSGSRFVSLIMGVTGRLNLTPEEPLTADVLWLPSMLARPWPGGVLALDRADGALAVVRGSVAAR